MQTLQLKQFPTTQKAFSLLEVMVVIVIMGIMASMILPNIIGRDDDARVQAVETDLRAIAAALDLFKLDNYRYPKEDEGLELLVESSGDLPNYKEQGYLKKVPEDPWGNPYYYTIEHGYYDIFSYGADGEEGGEKYASDIYFSEL